MKIVASISPKTSKGGSGEDDEAGYGSEKARSEEEAPLPNGSLPPKPNIMYIEVNLYTEKIHVPHSNYAL